VIENEYGSVGVDDQLVRSKFKEDEDVVEMNNGCICCTVRGDLVKTLNRIAKMIKGGKELDGVIIETTGMADPAPVAQTFFADDNVANMESSLLLTVNGSLNAWTRKRKARMKQLSK